MSKKLRQLAVKEFNKLRSSLDDQYITSMYLNDILSQAAISYITPRSGRIIKMSGVDPFEISTMISTQGESPMLKGVFNSFNNAQLSSLTPLIRMYMRTRTGKNSYIVNEIRLQNMQPEFKVLESVDNTGAVFGLKEANFSLAGKSPETAKNDINSTITFFGNNLSIFEQKPEYVNLIVPHVKTNGDDGSGNVVDSRGGVQTELVMQVGWNEPSAETIKNLRFTPTQVAAIVSQFQTYVMLYVGHDFSFNIDGSFTLRCEYASYIDQKIGNANFLVDNKIFKDVYGLLPVKVPKAAKTLTDKEKALIQNYIKENHDSASDAKKLGLFNKIAAQPNIDTYLKEKKKQLIEKVDTKIEELFDDLNFQDFLFRRDAINCALLVRACSQVLGRHSTQSKAVKLAVSCVEAISQGEGRSLDPKILFNTPDLLAILAGGFGFGSTTVKSAFNKNIKVKAKPMQFHYSAAAVERVTQDSRQLPRFISVTTFGEIVDCFIRNNDDMKRQLVESDINIGMGTLKVSSTAVHRGKNPVIIDIYDIPITYDTLVHATKKFYLTKTKSKATLLSFINVLLQEVKKYYLQGDPILESNAFIGANTLRAGQFTCSPASLSTLRTNPRTFFKSGYRSDLRRLTSNGNIRKLRHVYYIVAGPASDEASSLRRVDHYQVGAINSVIKKVSFTQANNAIMEAIRSDNIAAAYRDKASLGVLPQLYNVKMELIGNLNFIPGYLFTLFPTMVGISYQKADSVLKTLGLLGSYMTLKVEHSIGQKGFSTTINAYNVSTETYMKNTLAEATEEEFFRDLDAL